MSISSALLNGISGLTANSEKVGNISSNIANANTTGFRRSFSDLVTQGTGGLQTGVAAIQRSDNTVAGAIQSTGRPYDFAVDGDGFFVVSRNPNDPVASNYLLTRAGSFFPDNEGNLVNSAGLYLSGFRTNDAGNVGPVDLNSTDDLSTVNVNSFQVPGRASTSIEVAGNLPAQQTGVTPPGDPFISSVTYVDQLGGAGQLQLSWQPTATANTWTLNITGGDGTDYGSATVAFADSGPNAGTPASFAAAGLPIDPATGRITLEIANGETPQTLTLDLGAPGKSGGMTQFSGDYSALTFETDGAQTGSLVRAEMGQNGTLYGIFDNGERRPIFEIPVAEVPAPDQMRPINGGAYALTVDSGGLFLARAGEGSAGTIEGGALESSNVDIAAELTDLIQTQRAYSSNAKIVTTSDEMLDETLRIKR